MNEGPDGRDQQSLNRLSRVALFVGDRYCAFETFDAYIVFRSYQPTDQNGPAVREQIMAATAGARG
jgi:hypothetical protein